MKYHRIQHVLIVGLKADTRSPGPDEIAIVRLDYSSIHFRFVKRIWYGMENALDKLLPSSALRAVKSIGLQNVYEVRLRAGRASSVNVKGVYHYLGSFGVSAYRGDALVFDAGEIEQTVFRAAEHSVYAVQDQLIQSFVTLEGGVRVGVCGQTVKDSDRIRSVNQFGSVVIRVPHEVKDCSLSVSIASGSVLISGPPASGKTTFLRDLARRCSRDSSCNVVILDERGEIAACKEGVPLLDIGDCDVISNCDKAYGFGHAVRVLRPDVIVTDELASESDFCAALKAIKSGIRVFASIHAMRPQDLDAWNPMTAFDRIVWLDRERPGSVLRVDEGSL